MELIRRAKLRWKDSQGTIMIKKCFIYGAGGHAKVIIDCIRSMKGEIAFVCDGNLLRKEETFMEYPLYKCETIEELIPLTRGLEAIVAIGDNQVRTKIFQNLSKNDVSFLVVRHSRSWIGSGVIIKPGTAIMPNVVVNAQATIGQNCIINTAAVIEHDCQIGDHVHVAPTAVLCGGASVGEGTLIGVGAKILPGVKIGKQAIVGAGAAVTENVPDYAVVAGIPARLVDKGRG